MKNIKFILPLLALALFSCNDYLDVNTSPNQLTFDQEYFTEKFMFYVEQYKILVEFMNEFKNAVRSL